MTTFNEPGVDASALRPMRPIRPDDGLDEIPLMPEGARLVTVEDLPRVIAEALDAADKRREERAGRIEAMRNLEGFRQRYAGQLQTLERLASEPVVHALAVETRELLALIDSKIAEQINATAEMMRESIEQARAALDPPKLELLPGAALIDQRGKRR